MTDKEKILAEIESELSLCERGDSYNEGKWSELNHLKLFINSLPEEPVSEDLEKFANETSIDYRKMRDYQGMRDPITLNEVEEANYNGVIAGAQWQFSQLEKNRLAACERQTDEEREREQDFVDKILVGEHRQPTYSDAIEYGMKLQKIQTLKDIKEKIYRVMDYREKNNEKPHDDVYSILGHVQILIEGGRP